MRADGSPTVGEVLDEMGGFRLLTGLAVGCIGGFGVLFGESSTTWIIVGAGFLLTLSANVFSVTFHAYQAALFPTTIRPTGRQRDVLGFARQFGVAPIHRHPDAGGYGRRPLFVLSAARNVVVSLDVALLGPKRAKQPPEVSSNAATTAPAQREDRPAAVAEPTDALAGIGHPRATVEGGL
jgi:hypothetical protein